MSTPKQALQAPRVSEELQKMEYEPLNAVEKKLIWYTFSAGVVLLIVFLFISGAVGH